MWGWSRCSSIGITNDPIDATWEQASVIKEQFPNFHLEDKVALWGAGNDKPRIMKVYVRRKVNEKKGKLGIGHCYS